MRVLGTGNNVKCPISSLNLVLLCNKYSSPSANLKDLRIASICLLAFTVFLRYDELSKIIVSDLKISDSHLTIFVEKSKTDVYRDRVQVYISKTNSKVCPVSVISRYCEAAEFWAMKNHFFSEV